MARRGGSRVGREHAIQSAARQVLSVQMMRKLLEARQGLGRWDLAKPALELWRAVM